MLWLCKIVVGSIHDRSIMTLYWNPQGQFFHRLSHSRLLHMKTPCLSTTVIKSIFHIKKHLTHESESITSSPARRTPSSIKTHISPTHSIDLFLPYFKLPTKYHFNTPLEDCLLSSLSSRRAVIPYGHIDRWFMWSIFLRFHRYQHLLSSFVYVHP